MEKRKKKEDNFYFINFRAWIHLMLILNFLLLLLGLFLVVKGADILISCRQLEKIWSLWFFYWSSRNWFWNITSELIVSIDAIIKITRNFCWKCSWFKYIKYSFSLRFSTFYIKINLQKISRFDNIFHLFIHIFFLLIVYH